MSHRGHSDVVPYACSFKDSMSLPRTIYEYLFHTSEGDEEDFLDWLEAEGLEKLDLKGWDWDNTVKPFAKYGSKSDILEYPLSLAGGFKVALVNEAEGSHVGEYEISVIANSPAAINKFLEDFGFTSEDHYGIAENESVMSYW